MSEDAQTRFDSYLVTLRRLKETSARRDVLERDILLAVLQANKTRLSEVPSQEADQQHLVATLCARGETQPAHEIFHEWMASFLTTLNQYEVSARTGGKEQALPLMEQLERQETLLAKTLQGYVILAGVARDEFNDVILRRFGESALADLDDLAHAGFSDDRYWKALLERFVFGFVDRTCQEALAAGRFRTAREGNFVTVRFPLDVLLEAMPGTDKQIEKSRLQAVYQAQSEDQTARKAAAALAALLPGLPKPLLPAKAVRQDFEVLGRVAAMDPLIGRFIEVFTEGKPALEDSQKDQDESPEAFARRREAARDFLLGQLTAMAVGAAMALGLLREDLGKALVAFPAKEQERLLAVAGVFEPASLEAAHTLMLELALSALLESRVADEGGKVQLKAFRQRRAPRSEVEAWNAKGFNRVRQKLFFEDDPAGPRWLFFKAKTGPELAEAIRLSNMEPRHAQMVTGLWSRMDFKVEIVAAVNLVLVAKAAKNVQAKLADILGKLGLVKAQ